MTFNRGRNDGSRRSFEMHKAICDNCGKECEVPFRPTSGKPIFCSDCFERKNSSSDSRRYEGRNNERSEDRQMFEATCADCGERCKVPFRPTGDKPVFCSNCFGEKKNAGGNMGSDKFTELNAKLDKILSLLSPAPVIPVVKAEKPIKVTKKKAEVEEVKEVEEITPVTVE